jgi:hypothetical protein
MSTTILAGATDDHGVRKILLRYKVREEAVKVETLHEEKAGARELAIRYGWTLGTYGLLPGDEIEYQVGPSTERGRRLQTTWSAAPSFRRPRYSPTCGRSGRDPSTRSDASRTCAQQKSRDRSTGPRAS